MTSVDRQPRAGRIATALSAVAGSFLLHAVCHAASLQVGSALCNPGDPFELPVALTRADEEQVAAIQCDFSFDVNHFSWVGVTASSSLESAGKQLQTSQVAPGRWRVLAFGFNQTLIPAGVVFKLRMQALPAAAQGMHTVSPIGLVLSSPSGNPVPSQAQAGTVTIGPGSYHSADTGKDYLIELGELLRGIQLFNAGQYHCDQSTEDGYAVGLGPRECAPHNSDYRDGADWRLSLTELLRLIQFFNLGGYVPSGTAEDGYEPVLR